MRSARRRSLLQAKKQEERIIRLEADVKKYKSESAKLKKQIKQETEQYEILLSEKDSTIDEYLKISDCKYFYLFLINYAVFSMRHKLCGVTL